MLKGFRDFLMRGNIIELAVAVVIGAAFTAIVGAFTDAIIKPILARIGGANAAGLGFNLGDTDATFVDIGLVINAIITFVITAAVVYFIFVLPMNKVMARRKRNLPADTTPAPPSDNELLAEIRDMLKAQQQNRG